MQKTLFKICVLTLVAGLAWVVSSTPLHAEKKPESAAAEAGKKRPPRGMPFTGKLKEVDKAAGTIVFVRGEKGKDVTLKVTSNTRIIKGGQTATLDDATVGEEVRGFARQSDMGAWEAVSLGLGPKTEGEKGKGAGQEKK